MRFHINPALVKELEAEPEYQAALVIKAEEARTIAEMIAPRGETHYYETHFTLERIDGGGWRFGNSDFAAHWVEWGSVNNPIYAPLRRAVIAAGLDLRESPKPG